MKRLITGLGMTVFALGLFVVTTGATPVMADDVAPPAYKAVCDAWADATGNPAGECMSYFAQNLNPADADNAAAVCKLYRTFDFLELFGFRNQGECVSFVKRNS